MISRPVRRPNPSNSSSPLNNMMVNQLKLGHGEYVKRLLAFGARYDQVLDLVVENSDPSIYQPDRLNQEIVRQTLWAWSHRAPINEGVSLWWKQLLSDIKSQPSLSSAKNLSARLKEAIFANIVEKPDENYSSLQYSWNIFSQITTSHEHWNLKHQIDTTLDVVFQLGDQGSQLVDFLFTNKLIDSRILVEELLKKNSLFNEISQKCYSQLLNVFIKHLPEKQKKAWAGECEKLFYQSWKTFLSKQFKRPDFYRTNENSPLMVLEVWLQYYPTIPDKILNEMKDYLEPISAQSEYKHLAAQIQKKQLNSEMSETKLKKKTSRL